MDSITVPDVDDDLPTPIQPAASDRDKDAAAEKKRALAQAVRKAQLKLADVGDLTIQRRRIGRGFVYVDAAGQRIEDEETLARIRSLAIPPAYRDVRIAADPRAHLQAIGRDQAGRTQHRYHPDWNDVREARKARRLAMMIEVLPRIRKAVRRDMARRRLDRSKALACAVALIDNGHIRVGCEAYARDNGSHGAATLLKEHVTISGDTVTLAFRGKGGKDISCAVTDADLAKSLKLIRKLRGPRLLQYEDLIGRVRTISASDINAYLQAVSGADVTAKDFRMLGASAHAAEQLAAMEPAASETGRKRQLAGVMRAISQRLANTPAVVRKSYVHAVVVTSFQTGALAKAHQLARGGHNRRRAEVALGWIVGRMLKR